MQEELTFNLTVVVCFVWCKCCSEIMLEMYLKPQGHPLFFTVNRFVCGRNEVCDFHLSSLSLLHILNVRCGYASLLGLLSLPCFISDSTFMFFPLLFAFSLATWYHSFL
ncbi:hypothetical protein ILYODFUR_032167 [Ilyodon furcidens]|uniref:Uncharacterized protein n=1 Tax=Ilyodon furcidens TaxID=33524 RepID=A0ABV0UAW6_9TELE